jgi:ATP-dependent RNA helicase RhlE
MGGTALSFCDSAEKIYLRAINKLIKIPIPVIEEHPFKSDGDISLEKSNNTHKTSVKSGSFRFRKHTKNRWQRKSRRPKVKS